jgi:hypothetical protein
MSIKRVKCNDGSFYVLGATGNLSFGSYANAFASLGLVTGNHVSVNHLIGLKQPISKPMNGAKLQTNLQMNQ